MQLLKLYFKKWASFGGMLTCVMMPYILLYSVFPFYWQSIVFIFLTNALLSSWLLFNYWQDAFQGFTAREINRENRREVAAEARLQALIKKANMPPVGLRLLPKNAGEVAFKNMSFPFSPQIFLSETLFQSDEACLSQLSLEGLLAHELAHIKHYDTLFRIASELLSYLLSVTFIAFISASLLCSVTSMVALAVPFWGSSFLIGFLIMIEKLCDKISSRARESLADLMAASLTSPTVIIDSLYDYYLQYLYSQNLVFENDLGDPVVYTLLPHTQHALRTWRGNLKEHSPREIYYVLKKIVSPKPTVGSWYNSHPTLIEREKELTLFERERNSFTIL